MYLKKTIKYGNKILIRKYHTLRYGKQGSRERKKQPTKESMKRANERVAEKKLLMLMENNFLPEEDMFLTLTYKAEERPTVEEAKSILARFFRRMKRAYEKAGSELKYICTTEWNGKSIHHHIVINNVAGFNKILSECWKYGGKRSEPLYADYDYRGLAEYMIKETSETFRDKDNPWHQRYTCSRNLKKPEEKVEVIKANEWRDDPRPSRKMEAAGYRLKAGSVEEGVDIFGYPYQEYIFEQVRNRHGKKKL